MPDAVVIGAGPNGLAAAIRLAEAGRSVVLCEAEDAPGGAVKSAELTLPGFVHDVFSSVYPAGAASPAFTRMPLEQHGLEWVHPEACAASPLPNGRAAVLYQSVEDTTRSLNALHAGDGDRWADFTRPFVDEWDAVRDTMLAGFPPITGPMKLLLRGGPVTLLKFAALLPGTSTALGRRLFEGGDARAWLHASSQHGDAPPDKPGSAVAGFYLNVLGHAVGWPSPRGGAGRLTDALVAYFASLGGELRLSAPVTAVESAGGRVTGVVVAGEERIATRTVVADVMPHALIRLTGSALRPSYATLLKRYRYGASTLKVDWALDGPIPWTNEEVRRAGTIHVAGTEEDLLGAIETSHTGLPERPFLLAGQQTVADPSRAPEGKHTAWAYTHGPPHAYALDWAGHVDRVEAQIERFAPGFRDRIIGRHVLDPSDLEARDRNLVGGDVGGGSYALRQVVFRPVPRLSPYSTPITGLFIGSAAAFPGGAVHGIPGDAAARTALRS